VTASELIEQMQEKYDGDLTEADARSEFDAWVGVPREDVQKMAQFIVDEWGPLHLSTITGNDRGGHIDIIYHFVADRVSLNLRVEVDKGVDEIDTITPIVPAAIMYEREITDMFGVTIAGHPDPRRLVLPEDWPEGDYPLRRDETGDEEGEEDNG
jgi:membrane-bound hydrogenase subunit beta